MLRVPSKSHLQNPVLNSWHKILKFRILYVPLQAKSTAKNKNPYMDDFPIREYRTVLHERRRRWKDTDIKSVSKGLADGCQGYSLLHGVCDFFKKLVYIL